MICLQRRGPLCLPPVLMRWLGVAAGTAAAVDAATAHCTATAGTSLLNALCCLLDNTGFLLLAPAITTQCHASTSPAAPGRCSMVSCIQAVCTSCSSVLCMHACIPAAATAAGGGCSKRLPICMSCGSPTVGHVMASQFRVHGCIHHWLLLSHMTLCVCNLAVEAFGYPGVHVGACSSPCMLPVTRGLHELIGPLEGAAGESGHMGHEQGSQCHGTYTPP